MAAEAGNTSLYPKTSTKQPKMTDLIPPRAGPSPHCLHLWKQILTPPWQSLQICQSSQEATSGSFSTHSFGGGGYNIWQLQDRRRKLFSYSVRWMCSLPHFLTFIDISLTFVDPHFTFLFLFDENMSRICLEILKYGLDTLCSIKFGFVLIKHVLGTHVWYLLKAKSKQW